MTDSTDDQRVHNWLATCLSTLGIELQPDELTGRSGLKTIPAAQQKIRMASALAGVCDRMIFDELQDAAPADQSQPINGVVEAAERQQAYAFDAQNTFGRDPFDHQQLTRLFRMQRAFSLHAFHDPMAPMDDSENVRDPLMAVAGMAVGIAVALIRFHIAHGYGTPDEVPQAVMALRLAEKVHQLVGQAAPQPDQSESLDDVFADWNAETPPPDDIRRQAEAELDDIGMTDRANPKLDDV